MSFMRFYDPFYHRKAQSAASAAAAGRIHLVKTVPDMREVLFINTDPIIPDFDVYVIISPCVQPDMTVLFAVCYCVLQ